MSSGIILERGLLTGMWSFFGATLLALPTLAFSMKSVEQTMKISEMRKYLRSGVKRLKKDRDKLPKINERISKWVSEYAIARPFTQQCKKIIMRGGEGHDFSVDGLGVEVSMPISSYDETLDSLLSKIWNLVEEEFQQKGVDIVALEITHTRLGPQWWGLTDPRNLNIQKSIRGALKHAGQGKRSFILYTFKPNTFDALGLSYPWGEKTTTFKAIA